MSLKVQALLSRYPHLSEQELATLADAFPRLTILDYGLITSDEPLAKKLRAFERDHKRELGAPLSALIAFLAVPTMLGLGLLWWMLA